MKTLVAKYWPWVAFGAALLALKLLNRTLTVDDLQWFIAPVASLVELFNGLNFHWIAGEGYYASAADVLINRDCSGTNFFIISLALVGFVALTSSRFERWKLLVASPALAFAATILANASRITVALHWREAFSPSFLPAGFDMHEAIGIATYLTCLIGLYFLLHQPALSPNLKNDLT